VLILTRAEAVPVLRRVLVAPLTSRIRNIPTEVRLEVADGMPKECVVSLDNLSQISQALLGDPIASLSGARMHEVCKALAMATGCD
jgi:mRNA interferase MazF